jgi:hypothetical protein
MGYEMFLTRTVANKMDAMMYRMVKGLKADKKVYVKVSKNYAYDVFYVNPLKNHIGMYYTMTRMDMVNAYVKAAAN